MISKKINFVGNLNIGGNLSTKDSRTTWEDAFMTTHLNPVLSVSFCITCSNEILFALKFVCDKFVRFFQL